jgi:hypothetical protein
MSKKTILIDFDGVIHSYLSGWQGIDQIPDAPNTGAFEWITEAAKRYNVAVYSSRSQASEGRMAMINWFKDHGLDTDVLMEIEFPETKPAAWLTIDDRCLCFTGDWPSFDWIEGFLPWYRQPWATEGGLGASGEAEPEPEPEAEEVAPGLEVLAVLDQVVMEFKAKVKWVGFTPDGARQLAGFLLRQADAAEAYDGQEETAETEG